jgi:hypothetical protein
MSRKPARLIALFALAVALVAAAPAAADRTFHTSHAALHPVAGATLRSGFVNDIHTNGAVNSAHEEYHLAGAQPNTTYQVQLEIFADQSCSGAPFAVAPTAQVTTNGVGNGNADFTFPAGAPNSPPLQVGIVWQFLANGAVAYETGCVPVAVD